MSIKLAGLLLCGLAASLAAGQIQVAKGGRARCEIVVDDRATAAEKHAAQELSDYLSKITGVAVPVAASPDRRLIPIFVGQGPLTARLCPDVDWSKLGLEDVVIRSVRRGYVVAGGRPRGTLYAVYRLLGKLGVRWWTPWATDVPSQPNLVLPRLNERESPALELRSASWYHAYDPDWAARTFQNLGMDSLEGERGGSVQYAGFVHTYYELVPPKDEFAAHPEWFSLINGKRTTDNAQLCTTNPELRAFVLEQVKNKLRATPNATIVSVSQNDCFNPCQCDRCRALVKKEGSESALVLDLANYVAGGIKDEFPNVAVDTLAYQWSRHAPQTMKPRPNVIVRLCSIECDFGQPLNAPKNADFAKDVVDWSRLTNRLYVWDYVTNFRNYVQPIPDESVLGPNLKFLHDHGLKGMFEEGDYSSNGGAGAELKGWLLAQLMWDPNADDKALMHEFANGYYGPAGPEIEAYWKEIDALGSATSVTIYQDADAPFLTYSILKSAEAHFQAAEAKVANDPNKLWRVRISHLPIQYVYLRRWDEFKKAASDHGDPWPYPGSRQDLARQWLSVAQGPGPKGWTPVTAISESGATADQLVKSITG